MNNDEEFVPRTPFGYLRRCIPSRALHIRYRHYGSFYVHTEQRSIEPLRHNGGFYERIWLNCFLADKM